MGDEEEAAMVERALCEAPVPEEDEDPGRVARFGGGFQKPMVTADQYRMGRAVLDALEPGVYVKCSYCRHWQIGGEFVIRQVANGHSFQCEKCRNG